MHLSRLTSWLLISTVFSLLSACGGGSTSSPEPSPKPPKPTSYQVSYSADTGGSLEGDTQQEPGQGADTSAVTVVPDEGYHFAGWSDGRDDNPRTDTGITADLSVIARFAQNQYTLSYSADANGSLEGESEQQVTHGGDGTPITAVATEGYHFVSWSDDSTDNPRTDVGVSQGLSITAIFSNQHTLTYNAGRGGTLEGVTEQQVTFSSHGTEVTAIPSEFAEFIGWSDGVSSASRTDLNVQQNKVVTAQFRQEPWSARAHQGDLQVHAIQSQGATLDWPTEPGSSYNLIISHDSEIDLGNYAAYGATLELDVTPPYELTGLEAGASVYVALETNDTLNAWSSFTPRKVDPRRMHEVSSVAVDTDGTQYIGGSFEHIGEPTGPGVALPLANTSADHALAWPVVNGPVFVSIPDGEGGWYIGGEFTKVGEEQRQSLAQIDRLGRVTSWNPEPDIPRYRFDQLRTVRTLALDDDVIYVGGDFESMGGQPRSNLAAFNTEADLLPWSPGTGGRVESLVVHNGVVYAGGNFSNAGGDSQRNLAAFTSDGDLLPWKPITSSNNTVLDLAIEGDVLYVGGKGVLAVFRTLGEFDSAGNQLLWVDQTGVGAVSALAIDNGVVYVGGASGLAAFYLEGQPVAWRPEVDGAVHTLTVDTGIVYVGGEFKHAGGEAREHLAAFDLDGLLLSWDPGPHDQVRSLSVSEGVLFAGGEFTGIKGETREGFAALDARGDLLPWNPGVDGYVRALAIDGDIVYAGGGSFTSAGGEPLGNLVAFDAQGGLLQWRPEVDGVVGALAVDRGVVYVAGSFWNAGGESRRRLAAFDTSGEVLSWYPDKPTIWAYSTANSFAIDSGIIYIGGSFDSGDPSNLLAFDDDGEMLSWNPGVEGVVNTLTIHNGLIYMGMRELGTATGSPFLKAVYIDGTMHDWDPRVGGGDVNHILVDDDAIYVRGSFNRAGASPQPYVSGFAVFDFEGNLIDY